MQELELIESVKRGNNHAFEILVNKYKDMVFSISIKIVEDYHLAEECAQDSFIKAYQQLPRFRGESKFSSWLYRITLNTAYNKIRQRKPNSSLDFIDEPIEDVSLSGFEKLKREDQQKCINLALAQLKKMDAMIISLFYFEEQTIEELSLICELSEANVKVRLFRARKKLKEIMQESFAAYL